MIVGEGTIFEDIDTGKVERRARYFKAKVLMDHKIEETNRTLQEAIDDDGSIVFTDKSTSYVNIADYVIYISAKSRTNERQKRP